MAMTQPDVAFHFNAPHKVDYTCKLLRKATAAGARVAVRGPADVLARLDRELWVFSPQDFIPHVRMPCAQQVLERTSVVLCEEVAQLSGYGVLVNLGAQVPQGFEGFARVIEVVTHDESDRLAARARWKHYEAGGYTLVRHDLAQAA
jgi:DNA polymerase III subunit chi